MKYFFSILFFVLSISLSVGQSSIPTGAKWHYNLTPTSYSPKINEYIILEAIKDTIVQDSTCKKISVNYYNSNNEIISLGDEYLKIANEKVYNYHHGNFFLLYDFSKNIGDTIELQLGCNSTLFSRNEGYEDPIGFVKHKVIDKDSIEISGKKHLYITYQNLDGNLGSTTMSGKIIQGIGSIDFLFGQYSTVLTWGEDDVYGPLRCFNSSLLSFQQGTISCDSITGVDEVDDLNTALKIFPVPINETLTVSMNDGIIKEILIYNYLGEIVFSSDYNSSSININVNQFVKGIYVLKIKTNNNLTFKKIFK